MGSCVEASALFARTCCLLVAALEEARHTRCCGGRLRDDACCGLRRCRSEEDMALPPVTVRSVCVSSRVADEKLRDCCYSADK